MVTDSTGWPSQQASPLRASLRAWRRPRPLAVAVAVLVLVLLLPLFVVLGYVFVPAIDVWRHLAETVLTRYVTGSLLLALSVGTGTLVVGTATAWLVT